MGFFDSEDKIEKLKAMWAEGFSAAQIARAFENPACTRSTVIGKIHRLKLAARSISIRPKRFKPLVPVKKIEQPKPVISEPKFIGPLNKFPDSRLACRDIKGNPSTEDWRCCGQPVKPEKVYCEYHCQVNYQKIITYKMRDKHLKRTATGDLYRDFVAS